MLKRVLNKIIPQADRLKHFYLWSTFLAICLFATNMLQIHYLYSSSICIGSAVFLSNLINKNANAHK